MPKNEKTESKKASTRTKRTRAKDTAAPEAGNANPGAASPSLEQVRDRAYHIFRSGRNPSDPLADWIQAERELRGEGRT